MLALKKLATDIVLDIEVLKGNASLETAEPHRHEYYEIFWVLRGKGRHSIDFVEYPLSDGLIYFMTPGQVHHCTTLAEEMFAISFNSNLIHSDFRSQQILDQLFLNNRSCHPFITVDSEGQEDLKKLLDVLSHELVKSSCDNELINILFTGFLRYLVRYQPEDSSAVKVEDDRMLQLLKMVDDHFNSRKQTAFYADQLAMSSKRLNELSHKYFGKTVTQLVHGKTIVEARRQLAFTRKTVKSIAFDLGFKEVAYFSRFYKKSTSESPQDFRNNWLQGEGAFLKD